MRVLVGRGSKDGPAVHRVWCYVELVVGFVAFELNEAEAMAERVAEADAA